MVGRAFRLKNIQVAEYRVRSDLDISMLEWPNCK